MHRLIPLLLAATLAACSRAPAPPANGGSPARGQRLVLDYGCAACHTIGGIRAARGLVGPPLANVRQRAIIGGSLPNTPDNMTRWIINPRAVNPSTAMPTLGVTPQQARDIVAFLYSQ